MTPVITFETGGSPECIDSDCGMIVPKNDIEGLCKEIESIKNDKSFEFELCVEKAKKFDKDKKFEEYISLYEN